MKSRILSFALLVAIIVGTFGLNPVISAAPADIAGPTGPVVMSFGKSSANTAQYEASTGWEYTEIDGVECVKLSYSESDSGYVYKPKFTSKNVISAEHKFVRLVFMTYETGEHSITLTNNMNGASVILATDTYVSAGEWILSSPVDISATGAVERFAAGIHNTLKFDAPHSGARIFLKEMLFFTSMAEANTYSSEEVAGSVSIDPLAAIENEIRWDFSNTSLLLSKISMDTNVTSLSPVSLNGHSGSKINYTQKYQYPLFSFSTTKSGQKDFPGDTYYMAVTYMADDTGALLFRLGSHSAEGDSMGTLVQNTIPSDKWSTAVYGGTDSPAKIGKKWLDTIKTGMYTHPEKGPTSTRAQFAWFCNNSNANIYIREVVFFDNPRDAVSYAAQAPEYYNSGKSSSSVDSHPLASANGEIVWDLSSESSLKGLCSTLQSSDMASEVKNNLDCVKFVKSDAWKWGAGFQMFTTKAAQNAFTSDTYYVAATYAAPEGAEFVFKLSNGRGTQINFDKSVISSGKWQSSVGKDSTGKIVPIDPVTLKVLRSGKWTDDPSEAIPTTWLRFVWEKASSELPLYIKEIVFFTRLEDAIAYADKAPAYYNNSEGGKKAVNLKIGDNAIENYKIVIEKDANEAVVEAAKTLASRIEKLAGATLPVVTDDTEAGAYEILLGKTNRAESEDIYGMNAVYGAAGMATLNKAQYTIKAVGDKFVFASPVAIGVKSAVNDFVELYLHSKLLGTVSISDEFKLEREPDNFTSVLPNNKWAVRVNVADPEVFTEDFESDKGYFTEEDNKSDWNYVNGALVAEAKDELVLSYVHVYEYNAAFEADFVYEAPAADAVMGITLRYTAPEAYTRVGYDFKAGGWYIDTREGYDFFNYRVAFAPAELVPGTIYRLAATVDEKQTVLSVNGVEVLRSDVTTQVTPGRPGVYAKGVKVSVDNAKLTLLSGEGTILSNVNHTIVGRERDVFVEGASALEMNDGSILLTRSKKFNYLSKDSGLTWESAETLTDYDKVGHPNFLRLANGDWFLLNKKNIDGVDYMVSQLSSDDGKTWRDGGIICPARHDELNKPIGNMNDMVTQVRSGRIFVSMTYSSTGGDNTVWYNFVVFFCSDDNGITWKKCLDSRYIEGNSVTYDENGKVPSLDLARYFAESRIIQCADGRIRMLNSWNNYNGFVYCDSFDNGETWGPLQHIEELTCNRSSFAIARDTYAENDTTYYMVWCYDIPFGSPNPLPRSRFALAKSTDGMNWEVLGDVWRWESADRLGPKPANGNATLINHIVDPAITVTEDYVIVGSGISEYSTGNHEHYHNVQLQHVWRISKDTLN